MNGRKLKGGLLGGLIAKLRDDRKLELTVYAAFILLALIIFALSGGISCGETNLDSSYARLPGNTNDTNSALDESRIEARLAQILSGIRGAGKVEVMVVIGANNESSQNGGTDTGGLLSHSPSGKAVNDLGGTRVEGVIVIAEGADDIRVRTDIQSAVRSLLGIDASRIGVYSMCEGLEPTP